jgi:cell volume regulation protein A
VPVALLTAGRTGLGAAGPVADDFAAQMEAGIVAGVAVAGRCGCACGRCRWRSTAWPRSPLASGFQAMFTAGILVGDERAPYRSEIRFHSSLASRAEVVAFVMLGLTIHLRALPHGGAWFIGLALAALLAFAIWPLPEGALL